MNIFTYLKSQLLIQEVIEDYITLQKAGNYLRARCPFHHEKTASFTISPTKDIFYCFGCHVGGDIIAFIAKIENCSQIEAAQFLVQRYQLTVPNDLDFKTKTSTHEASLRHYEVCRAFALWCHAQLKNQKDAHDYLKARGIQQEHINLFMIGYMPGNPLSVKRCLADLSRENILLSDLAQASIIMQASTASYSPFEERIIFPIKDHMGRFCAFGGRIFRAQDTRPKYYNSKESEFFDKGSTLFGLDLAKKHIQESKAAFLVEGYTDCIAMVQHGYIHTVATLGTACTEKHLKLLSRYADYLYILYDGDHAGQQAVLRLTKLCWQANMELKVVSLPTGHDPASFLLSGNDLRENIARAQDIFSFFIAALNKEFATITLHEKVGRIRSLIETIQSIDDPLKQDMLLQTASRTFDIPVTSLKRELKNQQELPPRSSRQKLLPPKPSSDSDSIQNNGPTPLENRIFSAILNNMELLKLPKSSYLLNHISSPLGEMLLRLADARATDSAFDFKDFFDRLSEHEKKYVSKLVLEYGEVIDASLYEQLLLQFQKMQWKQIVREVTTRLGQAQKAGDTEKIQQIINEFRALKEQVIPQ